MIIEDQPAWNTHLRSSESLRKSPKRHFTDVSLSVAALGADKESLGFIHQLGDTKFFVYFCTLFRTKKLKQKRREDNRETNRSGLEAVRCAGGLIPGVLRLPQLFCLC
jgi:hypothetical protein